MSAPKKSLGQNFLMHQATADRIADAAELTPADTVLEVGPGTGMLTRALLARAGKVIAVEADRELVPKLSETFAQEIAAGKLVLIEGDIREFDLSSVGCPYHVAANIPYYITGELIRQLLTSSSQPRSLTLLVQKEVAERIARSKKESLLSLSVKVYGTPSYRFTVPRGAFFPAPNVDSAVLTVRNIQRPFNTEAEEARFFKILHAGFAHKRKFLKGNLRAIASEEAIAGAFQAAGLTEKVRPEDVPLGAWNVLTEKLP